MRSCHLRGRERERRREGEKEKERSSSRSPPRHWPGAIKSLLRQQTLFLLKHTDSENKFTHIQFIKWRKASLILFLIFLNGKNWCLTLNFNFSRKTVIINKTQNCNFIVYLNSKSQL